MGRLVFFSCLILFLIHNTYSFTLNTSSGASFPSDEVKVNIASYSCSNLSITNDELLSLIDDAVDLYWNTSPTSTLELVTGSQVDVNQTDFQTGLICQSGTNCTPNEALKVSNNILIACNSNATNYGSISSVLAVTVPNNVSGGSINGALILLNDSSSNPFINKSRGEKAAIIAHEIGHAIGLGHSQFDSNLMYYQSVSTRQALGWDDIDGVTYLYPAEQPFGGCGTIEFEQSNKLFLTFLATLIIVLVMISRLKAFTLSK